MCFRQVGMPHKTVWFYLVKASVVYTLTSNGTECARGMVKLKTVICMQPEEHLVSQLPSNGCSSSSVNNLFICTLSEQHTHAHTLTLLIFARALQLEETASFHHVQCTVQWTPSFPRWAGSRVASSVFRLFSLSFLLTVSSPKSTVFPEDLLNPLTHFVV